MVVKQMGLFASSASERTPAVPEGFRYQPEIITEQEEAELVEQLQKLDWKPFAFHGYEGNRRVVSFGLRYNYDRREVETASAPPAFLDFVRQKVADFTRRPPQDFKQIGINEYRAGAGVGWHRDKPQFGDVVGISLLAPTKLRFRRCQGTSWIRATHVVQPRSAYLLSGPARQVWEHSVPPLSSLRYSLMFRTLNTAAPASSPHHP
jgi:alkylated DNA repair dioxygenase AlkB